MHTLHISLLGDFRLVFGAELLTSVNTPRLQALLVYLLLHRQSPQPRQQIAFQFWPDSSEKQAHTNLRKLLFQLRNALPDADRFLTQDHLTVHWRPDAPYTLDVADLQAALARSRDTTGKSIVTALTGDLVRQALMQVVELYQGELLPGSFEEWLLPLRQALQQEVMDAMARLIALVEYQRDYQAGIRYAQRLLGLDPLQEGTYRRLMQLHALNGDRAAALHNYHTCATMLQQELGVDPAHETRTLYEQLLNQNQPSAPSAPALPPEAPLVGRQQEWQTLVSAWQQAQQGQAHLIALTGEAGIGKSRLLAELMRWVRAQGGGVAHSRFYEAEVGLAYAPLVEWLRSPRFQPLLAKLEPSWLSEIARLLPELLTAHPTLPAPRPLTEAWERQRFIEALARAILLDKGPLLLVIDDLQWADSETLTWLRYLLRYAPQARLLVVCAWRSEAVAETPHVQVLLRDLQRTNQATMLELSPLSAAETLDLAQQLTGGVLEAQEADQLLQITEGHPLFLVETLRTSDWRLALRPQPPGLEQPSPPQIQRVIQARLGQLSPPAYELAGVAATIGRHFRLSVLQQASGFAEETLVQALEELWQRRIIREQGSDAYDFSHDQVRAAVYQALSQARRQLLHRRVALALETVHAQNLAPVINQLALHYTQAQMPAQAFAYWLRTAQEAQALDAYTDADGAYSRALALHEAHLADDKASRFDLLLLRSAMAERQGQITQFAHDVERLYALAIAIGAPQRLVQAQVRKANYHRASGDHPRALQAGEAALTLARASADKSSEIEALRELGFLCWAAQDYGNALRYGREVLQLHRQQSDVIGEASALHNLAEIYRAVDSPRQAITLYEQALQLYWGSQDPRRQALTLYSLAYALRQSGQPERAHLAYARALSHCEQTGDRSIRSRVHHALATLHWERQQHEAAVSAMTQAVATSEAIGYLPGRAHGLLALGYMTACLGQRAAAERHLQAALTPLQLMDDEKGRHEVETRLQLLTAGQLDLPEPPTHMNWIRTYIVLAEGKVYCEFESPGVIRDS